MSDWRTKRLFALDKQEGLLSELRARTGVLLAASALAASFLGQSAFSQPSAGLSMLALLGLVLSIGASVFVLVPRENQFVFSLSGTALYEGLYGFREEPAELYRRLTYDTQRFWTSNDLRLQPLFRAFRCAAGALVLEILALVGLVSDTLV